MEFHRDCIFFRAKKVEKSLSVPLEAIEQIFVLRRIEKFQKQEVTSFVIRLKDDCEISFGKQIFDELVITLKTKQGKPSLVSVPISDTVKLPTTETSSSSKPLPSEFLDMPREEILLKIFKYFVAKPNIVESSKKVFCSSQGDTSVKCIVGVENGHLYPLRNGVYFLNKPYIFLPFDDMVGLEQGRAGSGRTTDFIVSMDNGDVHQFGMISTDETEHLSEYMQFVKKKLSKRRLEGTTIRKPPRKMAQTKRQLVKLLMGMQQKKMKPMMISTTKTTTKTMMTTTLMSRRHEKISNLIVKPAIAMRKTMLMADS